MSTMIESCFQSRRFRMYKQKKPETKTDKKQTQKQTPKSNSESLFCDICFKHFAAGPSAKGNLNRHLKLHTKYQRIKCNSCHKTYNNMSNFNHHLHQHEQQVTWSYTTEGARQQPKYAN